MGLPNFVNITPLPSASSPERELLKSVLNLAIADLTGVKISDVKQAEAIRIRAEVRDWFASMTDERGSFMWLCDLLQLDPDTVRRQLTKSRVSRKRQFLRSIAGSGVGGFRTREWC